MTVGAYILLFAAHATMGIWCIWYWTKPKTYGEAILVVLLGSLLGFIAAIITAIVKIPDLLSQPLPSVKGQTDDFEPLNKPNVKRDC